MTKEQGLSSALPLSNDVLIPRIGLGVFKMEEGSEVGDAVRWAIEGGYKSIDTAKVYANEAGVGQAIRNTSIAREDIFVTTKVWNSDQGYDSTIRAYEKSLGELGLEYVDLYLVHWPVKGKYNESWRALETLYNEGRVRAIGVSNFLVHHLEDVMASGNIVPMVNQIEFHPGLQQPELQLFCKENNVQLEAWSPIMKGRVMEIPELIEIGNNHGKNPVQVTLRWLYQKDIVAIPKSAKKARIESNVDIFDFELTDQEMTAIENLDQGVRIGPDPDNFNF
ncbi:MAG: aldo/keto reductase [Rhodothermales bacterium]